MVKGGGVGLRCQDYHILALRDISKQEWNSEVEKKVIEIAMVVKGGIIKAIFSEIKPSFSKRRARNARYAVYAQAADGRQP